MIEKGFKVIFEDSFCRIQDVTGQEILKVKMKGKSFSFDPIKKELVAFSTKASKTEMWHKRLGHCHLQMMQLMKTNELTVGLPTFEGHLPNCQACPYENKKGGHSRSQLGEPLASCSLSTQMYRVLKELHP